MFSALRRRGLLAAGSTLAVMLAGLPARAQTGAASQTAPAAPAAPTAPTAPATSGRVIHLVVPFGPGAVQDTTARAFNSELGAALGATVIVENRAGAGGSVGSALVAKAPADGNTLILAAASHHIAGHLYPKLAYHPLESFTGVAQLGQLGYALAVSSQMPNATRTADFIREVRAHPGRYNYASAGNGSATHLAMAAFAARAGLQMTHIPTKSTGEAINELLAGRVQAVISANIGLMGYQDDARLRLLASCSAARSAFLPQLPTVAESGLPGYVFESWLGVLAPAGTPPAEVARLNAAINQLMAQPAIKQRFERLGVEVRTQSVAQFQQLLAQDWRAMAGVVKASGAKME